MKTISAHMKEVLNLCLRAQIRQSAELFLQSSELGLPHPQASVPPPPLWFVGGYTLACGRGGGGVPIPTSGQTLWYSRYICTLR
jgi:hypothetical protein